MCRTVRCKMTDAHRLSLVRSVHTIIYLVMAVSTLALLYGGITGSDGWWLYTALILLAVETFVFVGNGMKCPLTSLAVKYGAEKGYAFDTFLPERFTRYTFRVFGSMMCVGLFLLACRWLSLIKIDTTSQTARVSSSPDLWSRRTVPGL